MKAAGEDAAVLTVFGEGATSEGDFSEAMNMAGVFQVPVVFFCQNNQYAISVPYTKQTASPTVAQKALGVRHVRRAGGRQRRVRRVPGGVRGARAGAHRAASPPSSRPTPTG